jgi:UDP-GlcNAc3NAcA epimerase
MNLVSVLGARPQFVKASVVSRELSHAKIEEVLVHTGQHYDKGLSEIFFEELGVPEPKYHLEVGSESHGLQTARMLQRLEPILVAEQPDWVLVYGDTNSTLAGSLASAKLHIPVAHVEAGLRSFNRRMPEEVNRVVADHLSDLLFAPTQTALENLSREGIPDEAVRLVGDVMYDAALCFGSLADRTSEVLDRLALTDRAFVLATIHRAENTDDPERLTTIVSALQRVGSDILPVVFPCHPRTKKMLDRAGMSNAEGPGWLPIEPVGFLDMLMLERHAAVIATDSGGVQKEAFFSQVPCITLRDQTEWVELIDLGWNQLVPPTSEEAIVSAIKTAIGSRGREGTPYGQGEAAMDIAATLAETPRPDRHLRNGLTH